MQIQSNERDKIALWFNQGIKIREIVNGKMNYMIKRLSKISQLFLILILITGWIFPDWPPTVSFAQEATSTPPALTATTTATSTPATDSPSPIIEQPADEETSEEPPAEELQTPEPPQSALPPQPPLKERKLEKRIIVDKNAWHGCEAVNFTVDISNKNSAIVELNLNGKRDSLEDLEIGSLPYGIDITFLTNTNYSWSPAKSDNVAVLQIVNQVGSQKGNFSIPIIYQSGNSTAVCQINVVNL